VVARHETKAMNAHVISIFVGVSWTFISVIGYRSQSYNVKQSGTERVLHKHTHSLDAWLFVRRHACTVYRAFLWQEEEVVVEV
jgi:hypothetical protein